MTVLAVLETQWRAPCPPFAGPTKYRKDKEATVTVLAVMAVSVVMATPLKLNPPNSTPLFRHPE